MLWASNYTKLGNFFIKSLILTYEPKPANYENIINPIISYIVVPSPTLSLVAVDLYAHIHASHAHTFRSIKQYQLKKNPFSNSSKWSHPWMSIQVAKFLLFLRQVVGVNARCNSPFMCNIIIQISKGKKGIETEHLPPAILLLVLRRPVCH